MLLGQTAESIYLMWKTTGDESWRERGYSIFNALQVYAKTPLGYTSLRLVNHLPVQKVDDQPRWVSPSLLFDVF